MSFQFPANPKDGDILVQPQEDGRLIKGTYNEATNTWAVGELPEEPGVPGPQGPPGAKGEKGDPGKGMAISGIVDAYGDLPVAAAHPLQFWIVDDENKVYYSDGNAWFDQGGPVVGPKGEDGADGADGADGLNGAPGKGWTSTTVIDERPNNYQVRFNSDDGLGFTTDNIMGPQGETGSLAVATSTTLGGIKIGRGLNIKPDGTLQAGETAVDLETVPLTPEGTVYNYNLGFQPEFLQFNNGNTWSYYFTTNDPSDNFRSDSITWTPPFTSTGAMVYFFRSSSQKLTGSWTAGTLVTPKIYIGWKVTASRGTFMGSGMNEFNTGAYHNLVFVYNNPNQASLMEQVLPVTKVECLEYGQGAQDITFTVQINLKDRAQFSQGEIGAGRMVIVPFRGEAEAQALRSVFSVPQTDIEEISNNLTGKSLLDDIAGDMTNQIQGHVTTIVDLLSTETDPIKVNQLEALRTQYLDIPNQPGTPEELQNLIFSLNDQLYPFTEATFRFQL